MMFTATASFDEIVEILIDMHAREGDAAIDRALKAAHENPDERVGERVVTAIELLWLTMALGGPVPGRGEGGFSAAEGPAPTNPPDDPSRPSTAR